MRELFAKAGYRLLSVSIPIDFGDKVTACRMYCFKPSNDDSLKVINFYEHQWKVLKGDIKVTRAKANPRIREKFDLLESIKTLNIKCTSLQISLDNALEKYKESQSSYLAYHTKYFKQEKELNQLKNDLNKYKQLVYNNVGEEGAKQLIEDTKHYADDQKEMAERNFQKAQAVM